MGKQQGGRGKRFADRNRRAGGDARREVRSERKAAAASLARTGRDDRRSHEGKPVAAPVRGRTASPVHGDFIEGRRACTEALRAGFPVKRALVAAGEGKDPVLAQLVDYLHATGVPVITVPRSDLDVRSAHGAHQGVMLEAGAFPYAELADVVARAGDGAALVIVLDHVTDAGNFGAIVRTAEVVGAAGVIIANKRAAEVTVATYKTSAGAVMHLPIARVPNIARALEDLKKAGFWCVGASEHATGTCWDTAFEGRIALVMGSEGEGISRLVLDTCDDLTRLPQRGRTESLTVAQATTALAYEWLRRNIAELGDAGAAVSSQGRAVTAPGAGE